MIKYKDGYKYQLVEDYTYSLMAIRPEADIKLDFIELSTDGTLLIENGYAWDGATGGLDTPDNMRGSLVHDVLCQLINNNYLDREEQLNADYELKMICLDAGMSEERANRFFAAVRMFDRSGLKEYEAKEILEAP